MLGHIIITAPVASDSVSEPAGGVAETVDSATVELPVISRHYVVDSIGEAWVSGPVAPKLDSLRFYLPRYYQTATVTVQQTKPPSRWNISLQAGVGMTPKGVLPYIGIGASFRLK